MSCKINTAAVGNILGDFFFNDAATTEIYTLSLHDALPIYSAGYPEREACQWELTTAYLAGLARSEEHTSELQSRLHPVCRLLLENKKHAHARSTAEDSHHGGDTSMRAPTCA